MKRRDEETTGRDQRKRRKKGGKADGKKAGEGGAGDIKTVDSRVTLKGGAEEGERKEESGADGEASIPEAEGGGRLSTMMMTEAFATSTLEEHIGSFSNAFVVLHSSQHWCLGRSSFLSGLVCAGVIVAWILGK